MKHGLVVFGIGILGVSAFASSQSTPSAAPMPGDPQTMLVRQYCAGCHSERGKSGGLSLASFDIGAATQHADIAEKMIRKVRAGMMPPPGARRPDAAAL